MNVKDMVAWCNEQMQVASVQDYCPNGLQVEGKSEVKKIVSGVTASQALIDAAINANADMLLVHHGLFWRKEDQVITGIMRHRLASLLAADINLLAYHLPLDLHPEWGNNVELGRMLGLSSIRHFNLGPYQNLGSIGALQEPMSIEALIQHVHTKLGRKPMHISSHAKPIQHIAWCTGAAQDGIVEAAEQGADIYLSGEISEKTVHQARELGIDYLACGHHATERYGVQALGRAIANRYSLEYEYIEISNPA